MKATQLHLQKHTDRRKLKFCKMSHFLWNKHKLSKKRESHINIHMMTIAASDEDLKMKKK